MFRSLIFLLLCFLNLFANSQKFELLADDVVSENGIVTANNNVVVYSQTYLITADRAIYNQKTEIIELFGNVNMMKGISEISRSNYAKINLKDKSSNFQSLFMMNKELEVWIKSDESGSDDEYYHTKNAVVSSCNVSNPDWSITSTSAKLNKSSKFLHMYNPVFRLGNVPVFYLPYFGFSTDKTRRSGLLPPEFGYKRAEGIYYKQPIYFAPYNQWDFQIDPQTRVLRGSGAYSTLRFVDSAYSKGEINFGFFADKDSYIQRQIKHNSNNKELKNKIHKGFELNYDRNRIIKGLFDSSLQENLWIDFTYLNDIDYLNLRRKDSDFDSLVTSNLNYFLSSDNNYFGIYANYYIDTEKIGSKNENKDTLQEIPTLQYHKFIDSFWFPNILYSIDLQSHKYHRKVGVSANQYELSIPISFHIPIFDDYLTFSFYENLYATHIDYNNKFTMQPNLKQDKSSDYIYNYHKFGIHSDIVKPYNSFYHTINYGLDYTISGYSKGRLSDEFIYDENGIAYENFLSRNDKKNEVAGYLTQYFYTSNGDKFLRHNISQSYFTDDNQYGVFKNVISFYPFSNLSLYNKFELSKLNKSKIVQSGLIYSNSYFSTNLWHTLKRKSDTQKDSYFSSSANINLPRYYKFLGAWQYDIERDYTKMWKIGLTRNKKCWNYGFVYQRDIEPITTKTGSATKRTEGFYFNVDFYPMGGIHYDFSIKKDPLAN